MELNTEVELYAEEFSGEVVMSSKKRVVIRFYHDADADSAACSLERMGFTTSFRRGQDTALPYLQVLIN